MIAQDTGSAIIGPARADLFFGAGQEAGRVSGRLRHPMRFVMLVPKSLDPGRAPRSCRYRTQASEKIAKLFPQTDPAKPAAVAAQGKNKRLPSPVPFRYRCRVRDRPCL